MSTAEQDLNDFRRFVEHRLVSGATDASLDELFDLWRHENPSADLYAEDAAAIAASIEDFKRGKRGAIAGEHSAELRREDLTWFLAEEPELVDQIMEVVYRTRETQALRAPSNRSRDS